jgi:hypothetical protein
MTMLVTLVTWVYVALMQQHNNIYTHSSHTQLQKLQEAQLIPYSRVYW